MRSQQFETQLVILTVPPADSVRTIEAEFVGQIDEPEDVGTGVEFVPITAANKFTQRLKPIKNIMIWQKYLYFEDWSDTFENNSIT